MKEKSKNYFITIIGIIGVIVGIWWIASAENTPRGFVAPEDVEYGKSLIGQTTSLNDIHIPVILHAVKNSGSISTQRDSDTIFALFQKSQDIWNQAHIVFDIRFEETILNEETQEAVERKDFGKLYALIPTDNRALHVFFVRTLGGSNGVALPPSLALVADRTSVHDFRATAHEIGHLLGLSHVSPDRGRLLFRGANGTTLTEQEIVFSRSRAILLERNAEGI